MQKIPIFKLEKPRFTLNHVENAQDNLQHVGHSTSDAVDLEIADLEPVHTADRDF